MLAFDLSKTIFQANNLQFATDLNGLGDFNSLDKSPVLLDELICCQFGFLFYDSQLIFLFVDLRCSLSHHAILPRHYRYYITLPTSTNDHLDISKTIKLMVGN